MKRCPACHHRLIEGRWDLSWRYDDDGSERQAFGIPGALCRRCCQVYVDPALLDARDLTEGRCTFAIESDVAYRARVAA